jgi:hypothetical protein
VRNDRERSGMPDLKSTRGTGTLVGSAPVPQRRRALQTRFAHAAARGAHGRSLSQNDRLDVHAAVQSGCRGSSRLCRGWNLGILRPVPCSPTAATMIISIRSHPSMRRLDRGRLIRPIGGYAGTQFIAALSKRFPNFGWAPTRATTLSPGRPFVDSPLVQRKSYCRRESAFRGSSSGLARWSKFPIDEYRTDAFVPSKSSMSISRSTAH